MKCVSHIICGKSKQKKRIRRLDIKAHNKHGLIFIAAFILLSGVGIYTKNDFLVGVGIAGILIISTCFLYE